MRTGTTGMFGSRGGQTVQLLPSGLPSENGTHLDWRPAGDGSLAPPRQCLVQISGFQYPKTAYVLLGLRVRPVGDDTLPLGCARSDLALPAGERPTTNILAPAATISSLSASISRDVASVSTVVVVGAVDSNQILCHGSSSNGFLWCRVSLSRVVKLLRHEITRPLTAMKFTASRVQIYLRLDRSVIRWLFGRPNIDRYSMFLFQLPNPLLQELPLWFLLGQGQGFLISGPSLSCPAEPAAHICTG